MRMRGAWHFDRLEGCSTLENAGILSEVLWVYYGCCKSGVVLHGATHIWASRSGQFGWKGGIKKQDSWHFVSQPNNILLGDLHSTKQVLIGGL